MDEFKKMGVVPNQKIERKDVLELMKNSKVLAEINRMGACTVKEMLLFLEFVMLNVKNDYQIVDMEKFKEYWKLEKNKFLPKGFSKLISFYYKGHTSSYYFDIDYQNLTKRIKEEDADLMQGIEAIRPGFQLKYMFNKDEKEEMENQIGEILDAVEDIFEESDRLAGMHQIIYRHLVAEMKTCLKAV